MRPFRPEAGAPAVVLGLVTATLQGCAAPAPAPEADLLVVNARVYTLAWGEPAADGTPAPDAPFDREEGWRPDAEAVAVRDGRILFVGSTAEAERFRGEETRVLDAAGGTLIPGLVDAHVHLSALGESLAQVNLVGVTSEAEAVERVAERAAELPPGEWIVGYGWDEGAWADRYPDNRLLSERVPDHPVYLRGLHGYAGWANRLALERAGITRRTRAPRGGQIRRDRYGEPTGLLLNRAVSLIEAVIPPPTAEELEARIAAALAEVARSGYTMVHEAGADSATLAALARLDSAGRLPVRVFVMLSAQDTALVDAWLARGPDTARAAWLRVAGVKAFYDGALGSRGARLLEDYTDRPGYRGVSGRDAGFDEARVSALMGRGFQAAIHAIGDAANRAVLDFYARVFADAPELRAGRHRIEHAQVVHPRDFGRFAEIGIIASMQPTHAVEDKAWAEARLGPHRITGAYAWRTLRRRGARLVFSSDLPGSDHDVFYGLHSAITRRDRELQPPMGWYARQRLTPEEAVRAYTVWAAYASHLEGESGVIAPGRLADLTLLDLDPFVAGIRDPERLLDGRVAATIVAGRVVYEAGAGSAPVASVR
jgi:predicted amidohydrolase YtcJ